MARIVKPPEERKREIVETAKKLFAENGYEKTQINDIAKTLGIAHGLIYHYFKSKANLFDAVMLEIFEDALSSFAKVIHSTRLSPIEKLKVIFEEDKQQSFHLSPMIKLLYGDGEAPEILERIVKTRLDILVPLLEKLFIEGCQNHDFDCPDPAAAAHFCLYGEMGIRTHHRGSEAELSETIKKMYYRVLGISLLD